MRSLVVMSMIDLELNSEQRSSNANNERNQSWKPDVVNEEESANHRALVQMYEQRCLQKCEDDQKGSHIELELASPPKPTKKI